MTEETKSWRERAEDIAIEYAGTQSMFTATDIRIEAELRGLEKPSDPRAWGAVLRSLKNRGLVSHAGWMENPLPEAHGRPTRAWSLVL